MISNQKVLIQKKPKPVFNQKGRTYAPEEMLPVSDNFVLAGDPLVERVSPDQATERIQYRPGSNVAPAEDGALVAQIYGIAYIENDNATISVEIPFLTSPDEREGWLLVGANAAGKLPDENSVAEILNSFGVKYPCSREATREQLEAVAPEAPAWLRIAESPAPADGTSEETLLLKTSDDPWQDFGENPERIDFREKNLLVQVLRGEGVLRLIPAKPAVPGSTIFGRSISARFIKKKRFRIGKNLERSARDREVYLATVDGFISRTGETVNVLDLLAVGAVNMSTGNIRYHGTIHVEGSIHAGMTVEAGGDILVDGLIEAANVKADGFIAVKGGILGGNNTRVRSGGKLYALYVTNANVHAESDIVIKKSCINSILYSGGSIQLGLEPGKIIGGLLVAQESIEAREAGNSNHGETILKVGSRKYFKEKKQQTLNKIKRIAELQVELIAGLKKFLGVQDFKQIAAAYQKLDERVKGRVSRRLKRIQRLKEERQRYADLMDSLGADQSGNDAFVLITDKIYAGVSITVEEEREHIQNDRSGGKFSIPAPHRPAPLSPPTAEEETVPTDANTTGDH